MPGPPLLGSCNLPSGVSLSPDVWLATTEAVYEEIQHRQNHFTQRGET